jgi:hypothetical protein
VGVDENGGSLEFLADVAVGYLAWRLIEELWPDGRRWRSAARRMSASQVPPEVERRHLAASNRRAAEFAARLRASS